MRHWITALALLLSFTTASLTNAVTLTVDSGVVTGATGLNIGGTIYSLGLNINQDCAVTFSGCDEDSDFFPFTESDQGDVTSGLTSFLDQVNSAGFGASDILGCTSTSSNCVVIVPIFEDNSAISFAAARLTGVGTITPSALGLAVGKTNITFVNSSLGLLTPVPLPAAVWLFLAALGGLVGLRRVKGARA
ncbi:MAG: VPLPA-CTERM sorting domain-containing protein [Pseudomonadota bacterium]